MAFTLDIFMSSNAIGARRIGQVLWLVALVAGVSAADVRAKEYYVSSTGSDDADGTSAAPWRTIQKAAEVMKAGDRCIVRAGIYREQIRPGRTGTADKPLEFIAADGDEVVIAGADPVTNWKSYRDGIYTAAVSWPIDQVFVDGERMIPARHPNAGDDPYDLRMLDVSIDNNGVCTFDDLSRPADFWEGGIIWGMSGRAWVARTAKIARSNDNTVWVDGKAPFRGEGRAFLFGVLGALDAPREWYQQGSTLYLWLPGDQDPSARTVEVTHRRWAFDLSGRAHIRIRGFEIFAAGINMDRAEYCVVDECRVRYASFERIMEGGFNRDRGIGPQSEGLGIAMGGQNNTVRNTVVAFCVGDGISVYGRDNRVENCVVHDCDFSASDCAPINVTGQGHHVSRCTLFNAGRSGLVHRKLKGGRIEYNHIHDVGLMTNDLGGTYTFTTDGKGTVLAYNRVHDVHCHTGIGIYVDNFSPNHIVHHNLCYDVEDSGIRLNTPTSNVMIYHNTLTSNGRSLAWWGRDNNSTQTGTMVVNNIMTDAVSLGEGSTARSNYTGESPGFVDAEAHDFRLTGESPCIDAAISVDGINDAFVGDAPDIGCFESGKEKWRAGSTIPRDRWYQSLR